MFVDALVDVDLVDAAFVVPALGEAGATTPW